MTITAKYPGKCATCGEAIVPGQQIEWDKPSRTSAHVTCPTAAAPVATGFAPTAEQAEALAAFSTGASLAIEAGAGTGKTSTLKLLAESTTRRGQYIAFNKAIVVEAGEKMPSTVTCSTAHSLAYRAVGAQYAHRLRNSRRVRSEEIAAKLGVAPITITGIDGTPKTITAGFLGGLVMRAVTKFCQTADAQPETKHIPYIEGIDTGAEGRRGYDNNDRIRHTLIGAVRAAWADLMDTEGTLPFKHDHYLKAWQLSGPRIQADYILFDEAQDANPVMQAIVSAQTHAQIVWVGDSQQQIYGFTGAVNALANVSTEGRTFLTQSFRFGPAVAEVANTILARLDAELRIVGTDSLPSVVEAVAQPDAILTRTNALAVRTVLGAQADGVTVHLVGGGTEVVRFAKGAQALQAGVATDHPDLACFNSWGEVKSYVEDDEQGDELKLMVNLVEDFGPDAIITALDRMIPERDADLVVSTAHKSKGREWNAVQLGGDFPPENPSNDELRLLYVACTRAKLELDITAVAALDERAA